MQRINLPALEFDRFDIHTKAVDMSDKIKLAESIIANEAKLEAPHAQAVKQIGIYYAFQVRKEDDACRYLTKYQETTTKGTVSYADATALIGYAHTIAGSYKDDSLFKEALAIYDQADQTQDVLINKAFVLRYIGLMHHRKKEFGEATQYLQKAIAIQKGLEQSYPPIKIDLAESLHIMGVIATQSNKLNEAETFLNDAYRAETEFCAASSEHFLKFVTMQSLGNLWMRLGKLNESLVILQDAYKGQIKLFGKDNADTAKTKQFTGDTLWKMGRLEEALQECEHAKRIKMQLFTAEDPILGFTLEAIRHLSIQYADSIIEKFPDRAQLALSHYQNAYQIMNNMKGVDASSLHSIKEKISKIANSLVLGASIGTAIAGLWLFKGAQNAAQVMQAPRPAALPSMAPQ